MYGRPRVGQGHHYDRGAQFIGLRQGIGIKILDAGMAVVVSMAVVSALDTHTFNFDTIVWRAMSYVRINQQSKHTSLSISKEEMFT